MVVLNAIDICTITGNMEKNAKTILFKLGASCDPKTHSSSNFYFKHYGDFGTIMLNVVWHYAQSVEVENN